MARHRHLPKAPLREALIDLQFEERVPIDVLDAFAASVASEYKMSAVLWEAYFGLTANEPPAPTTQVGPSAVGRRLEAKGKPYVVQCRRSGFTVSRLTPYGTWEELQQEAETLWAAFQGAAGAVTVNRLAVRYINAVKIPLPIRDLAEYLTCPPKVPDSLPQALSGFLTRVIIPDESANCVAIVTQALEGPPAEGTAGASITVLLDIDVYRGARMRSESPDVWATLRTLRDQKNRMFFEHITEKTAELYE